MPRAPERHDPRRRGLAALLGLLVFVAVLWGIAHVAAVASHPRGLSVDRDALRALRERGDPGDPLGPAWLVDVGRDVSSLGSQVVLGLAVLAVAGFLVLQRHARSAVVVLVAAAGAWGLGFGLKTVFRRPRPDVVPHLSDVETASFPSAHAVLSAAVYLTLAALVTRFARRRATRAYTLVIAVVMTALVGASRVFLGVHHPTDVLAGWALGAGWAACVWLVARWLQERGQLDPA